MNHVFQILNYAALSQAALGGVLLLAAAVISAARGQELSLSLRDNRTWPVSRRLAVVGLWLLGAALATAVIAWLSFYPARQA